jgi:hypothetical protein
VPFPLRARFRSPVRRLLRVGVVSAVVAVAASLMPVTSPAAVAVESGSVGVLFTRSGIWGGSHTSSYALTTKSVLADFHFSKAWYSTGGRTAPVTATVERRSPGGVWRATAQRVTTTSTLFHIRIAPVSTSSTAADVTRYYRLRVVGGGVVGHGDVSPAVKLKYVNPYRFTGAKRYLFRTVHRYCPAAVVRFVSLPGNAAGQFSSGQYSLLIDPVVRSYPKIHQRAVALHECGHYLQWRNYGATATGWARMQKEADAVYGTNSAVPVEHMADCIAQAANPGGYLGYGGVCTAKQLRYASRMLAGERLF